jgi:hypothetical protein
VPGTKRPSSEESETELIDRGVDGRDPTDTSVGINEAGELMESGAAQAPQKRFDAGLSVEQRAHVAMSEIHCIMGAAMSANDQFLSF